MFDFVSWLRKWSGNSSRRARRLARKKPKVNLEGILLEDRVVPSVDLHPAGKEVHHANSAGTASLTGYTPAQIRDAYGIGLISFGGRLGDGTGQTIAIVDVSDDPNIQSDLAVFDNEFGLPAPPSFVKMNEYGSTTNLPKGNMSDDVETTLDVEWAHAIAPGASIDLIEANSAGTDLNTAMQTAENLPGVSVISLSWGYDEEPNDEQSYDMYYMTPPGHQGVTVLNASGDNGASALGAPDNSPDVVTVGGTSLVVNGNSYGSETAWSGSTGGTSKYEPEPSWQEGVQSTGFRTAPDVAFEADPGLPGNGVDVYDSYEPNGVAGWTVIGGTSLAAPCWAGLIAITDQGRALQGEGPLDGPSQTLPALYSLPSSDFHQITSGSNGKYQAGPGYNEVTGLGSPIADQLVPDLVNMQFMPDGEVGQQYNQTITVQGTVSYSLTSSSSTVTPSSLGLDFTVNGDQLTITGTPTQTGTFGFNVTSSGFDGITTQTESLTINPDLTLSPSPLNLPGGNVGTAYSQTITAAGGSGDIQLSYAATPNTQTPSVSPATVGLTFTISGSTLEITGTPTTAGIVTFTVTAKDASGSVVEQGYTINVGLTLSALAEPVAGEDAPYDQTIVASGGNATLTDIITSTTTPEDLGLSFTVNGNDLEITGTPDASGTINFNVVATSGSGTTINYYTLEIVAPTNPTVTTNPANATVDAGNGTSFSAGASDGFAPPLSVQWQISTDGSPFTDLAPGSFYGQSVTSDTLTITGAPSTLNGAQYQAVFTNATGLSSTSGSATLTVDFAPVVENSPSSTTVLAGGNTSFSASASDGYPVPTTVQWQISTDGSPFTDLAPGSYYGQSVTSDTLTITAAPASLNGAQFQAVFSNAAGLSATSGVASLTVDYAPAVENSPSSATVLAGGSTSFSASATDGNPVPTTVQWQFSVGGGPFTNLVAGGIYGQSVTSDTLTITGATAAMNGYEYRALFSNASGLSTPTAPATLTVQFGPTITHNPTSATINAGSNASFTAAATPGSPAATVQWQISTDGSPFTDLQAGSFYGQSVTSDTLTITGAPSTLNGAEYQAVFSNTAGFSATTSAATLKVDSTPQVVTDPVSSITIDAGSTITLSASATGSPTPTVHWQVSTNGGKSYINLVTSAVYSGVATDTLTITNAPPRLNGDVYRALFSNTLYRALAPSKAFSTTTTLTVDYAPTITHQPSNLTVDATLTSWPNASFTAVAAGGNPLPFSLQWEISTDGGQTYTDIPTGTATYGSSVNSNTLTITQATSALTGDKYRAVFSNSAGLSVTSNAASLTVDVPPSVTSGPSSQTIDAGQTVTFTAAASGYPTPNVHWQISTNGGKTYTNLLAGGVYGNSVTSTTLTITNAPARLNGDMYRAVFSKLLYKATVPSDAVTNAATLTVNAPVVILGTKAGQKILETATIAPFASAIVTDPGNSAELVTVQVSLSNSGVDGTLGNLGAGSYDSGTGVYSLENVTISQAQEALRSLTFTPTQSSATTTFTISITDIAGTTINDLTTVVVA